MAVMNVQSTGCTPYFCNKFEAGSNDMCTICNKKLDGFIKYKYPTPAGSSFLGSNNNLREFVVFDVSKIVPSDGKGGASHGYAHRECMEKTYGHALQEFPTPACNWVGMQGKKQLQTNEAYKYLFRKMQIYKPDNYDKGSMSFLKCIGDMGLMDSISANHKPPTGTVYRTHDGVKQCMEFVHFDKFHGMQIDPDNLDPSKRAPIMSNYTKDKAIADEMNSHREKSFNSIYGVVDYVDKLTGQAEKLNLVENEAKSIEGFSVDHVFLQQRHHGLLDTGHRWWNTAFTFRILIQGKDAGIMEFKIVDNNDRKNKRHPGKSLFVYNVAAYIAGSKLCEYVFWFAKCLALYMNRFTDIKRYDEECIKQVYLTTSSLNKAMKRSAPDAHFTEVVITKVWWDRDYFWNVPYVHTYTPGLIDFPTNIVASLPSDSYVPESVLTDNNSIVDTLLMPDIEEIDPSLKLQKNKFATGSRCRLDHRGPVDNPKYFFCPQHLVFQPKKVNTTSLATSSKPHISKVDPSSTVLRRQSARNTRHTLKNPDTPEPAKHDELPPPRFTRSSLK